MMSQNSYEYIYITNAFLVKSVFQQMVVGIVCTEAEIIIPFSY